MMPRRFCKTNPNVLTLSARVVIKFHLEIIKSKRIGALCLYIIPRNHGQPIEKKNKYLQHECQSTESRFWFEYEKWAANNTEIGSRSNVDTMRLAEKNNTKNLPK